MFGLNKKQSIAEYEARGEIDRVYHEIKRTLRVTGVNLNFRTWAAFGEFLPLVWDTMRRNVEVINFESAADQLRVDAARNAVALGPLDVQPNVSLGESQCFQIRAALDLYHYVNPKLLLFTSAVSLLLHGEKIGRADKPTPQPERLERAAPAMMYAMEMESDAPDDKSLQALYDDIKETLSLRSINSDYRTLALWPEYLSAAWRSLKPGVHRPGYQEACNQLRKTSRSLALELPYSVSLDRQAVSDAGADVAEVIEATEAFEQLLPGLILNIALLQLDWRQTDELARSPFPAATSRFDRGEAL